MNISPIKTWGNRNRCRNLSPHIRDNMVTGPRNVPSTSLPSLGTEEKPLWFCQEPLDYRKECGQMTPYNPQLRAGDPFQATTAQCWGGCTRTPAGSTALKL